MDNSFSSITVVAVYGHQNGAQAIPAIEQSIRELPGSIGLLISLSRPDNLPSNIAWRGIFPMNYKQYSLFMMYCLHDFVDTEYALTVQDDGWVVAGTNWSDDFFGYDYIGAPCHSALVDGVISHKYAWAGQSNRTVIQNGGFSLRSKRLMRALIKHGLMYQFSDTAPLPNEDVQLSGLLRSQLETCGIRFAPENVAKYFSVEYCGPGYHDDLDISKIFGLHGQTRKLLANKRVHCSLPKADVAKIYREAEILAYLQSTGHSITYPSHLPSIQSPVSLPLNSAFRAIC